MTSVKGGRWNKTIVSVKDSLYCFVQSSDSKQYRLRLHALLKNITHSLPSPISISLRLYYGNILESFSTCKIIHILFFFCIKKSQISSKIYNFAVLIDELNFKSNIVWKHPLELKIKEFFGFWNINQNFVCLKHTWNREKAILYQFFDFFWIR